MNANLSYLNPNELSTPSLFTFEKPLFKNKTHSNTNRTIYKYSQLMNLITVSWYKEKTHKIWNNLWTYFNLKITKHNLFKMHYFVNDATANKIQNAEQFDYLREKNTLIWSIFKFIKYRSKAIDFKTLKFQFRLFYVYKLNCVIYFIKNVRYVFNLLKNKQIFCSFLLNLEQKK